VKRALSVLVWGGWLCLPLAGGAQSLTFGRLPISLIEQRLQRLAKDNAERGTILHTLFSEAGCREHLTLQQVRGSRVPNVICILPGTDDQWIVVGAHFDKAAASAEGAVDNWSGASLLPSLFASLARHPRRHKFVFIGFTDEERGLVGSSFYVSRLSKEERAKVRAMINIDSVGLTSTKVWVSRADKELLSLLGRLANGMKFPVDGVSVENVGNSDSYHFVRNKIPVIDFHSITQPTLELLHSPRDIFAAVSLEDYYTTYELLAAYLAFLDFSLDSNSPPSQADR